MTGEPFWSNRFHWCALAAGFLAASEGWLHDSERVRRLADEWYEQGAFADRVPPRGLTSSGTRAEFTTHKTPPRPDEP